MPAQDRPLSLLEEGLHQDHAWAADGVALPYSIGLENFGEGSTWVLDTISFFFFFRKMGLAIEGREWSCSLFLPPWKLIE